MPDLICVALLEAVSQVPKFHREPQSDPARVWQMRLRAILLDNGNERRTEYADLAASRQDR